MTINRSRLSPFVEKVILRKGLNRELIRRKSSSGLEKWSCVAIALVVGAAAHADDAFFRRCEIERRAALVNGDAATLGRLMAHGAQYIHSNGEIDDEAKLQQRLASGALRYRMIVANEENYACNATGCEVTGTQTLDVTAEGRELTFRNRFRVTWLNVAGACQFVAYQSAPLAK